MAASFPYRHKTSKDETHDQNSRTQDQPPTRFAPYGSVYQSFIVVYGRLIRASWTNRRSVLKRYDTSRHLSDNDYHTVITRITFPDTPKLVLSFDDKLEVWLLPIVNGTYEQGRFVSGLILSQTTAVHEEVIISEELATITIY